MTRDTSHCDDSRLTALLFDEEGSDLYRAAAGHVESCSRCRERLTELAADVSTWREARTQLRELPERYTPHEVDEYGWSLKTPVKLDFLSAPTHPEMLGRLGRYDIERAIGSGGMGIVLKAHDTELNRPVAIKVMAPHLAHSGAARQRFAREARAAAAVVHEHVVAIYDVIADAELPYLVMQYVPGRSLQSRIDECGPLSAAEVLRIGIQAALGLEAAHAQGLVHRDIKPANILLQDGVERITLTDFGLARAVDDATMTHSGIIAGTPQYMSPEQARGEPIDHRSDLFSLGSVLYAMCTGRAPFRAETTMGVLRRITDADPRPIHDVNPDVPRWLIAIISKLLTKEPQQRFESAAEVALLLEGSLKHMQQPDAAPLPEKVRALIKPSPAPRQNLLRENWISLTVATLLLVASAAMLIRGWQEAAQKKATENVYSTVANESGQKSTPISSNPVSSKWDDGIGYRLLKIDDEVESIRENQWP